MKALVLKQPGLIEYMEKPEPELEDAHGVLLSPILVSPCTSDVHTIWQGSPKRPNLTLGHECIARIAAAGPEVHEFHEGDVVAVPAITPDWDQPDVMRNPGHAGVNFSGHALGKSRDGAFQSLFYLPHGDRNLACIPEGLSAEDALMCVDAVSTGFTAAEEAGIEQGDLVTVMGTGAVGLGAILAARCLGASKIYAVGSRTVNTQIACRLGSTDCPVQVLNYRTLRAELPEGMHPLANSTGSPVVNQILSETGTKGVDRVLICGGGEDALAQAVDMVKYGTGVISNVMYYGGAGGLVIPKFSSGRGMAGKTIRFSLSRGGRSFLEHVMDAVLKSGYHPEQFITRRYQGIDAIRQAIYDMKEGSVLKAAVYMEQERR